MQQKVTFDLSENKIICITGKNSVGKTTLIRAIKNLTISSTFQETAAPYIFNKNSFCLFIAFIVCALKKNKNLFYITNTNYCDLQY